VGKERELCDCGKMAVWIYMPGYGDKSNPYHCEDCISSKDDVGCSCNWHHTDVNAYFPPLDKPEVPEGVEGVDWRWVVHPGNERMDEIKREEGIFQYLDEKGRPHPCCEYEYDKDGFEIYTEEEEKELTERMNKDLKERGLI
jgi:hypothetical protein